MSRNLERYTALGLSLIVFGAVLAAYSYYILLNNPLTAMGLACVIIGTTTALTPSSPVPARTVRAMVEASCINIEALLEEFNTTEGAIYLPPREEGRGYAYVPLSSNPGAENALRAMEAPLRVVTDAGGEPGLMVFPPGSELVKHSLLGEEAGVEDALNYVLVDYLEAVKSVKSIETGDEIIVSLTGSRLSTDFPRFNKVMGSLPVSISGSIISSILRDPIIVVNEFSNGKEIRAKFRKYRTKENTGSSKDPDTGPADFPADEDVQDDVGERDG
jgi:hypothetical protein